ncbi:hypothetical protein PFLUV_G00213400 [Perca fluviatilis]|uniref:Uncharacterized protein n=1 Tax=Perca fluviatilis TaxID=8168 RepID=A0A6A5EL43_PERFL|nr:hypothetical protein PFLUV_G00213400 [Perca fluviatilis]
MNATKGSLLVASGPPVPFGGKPVQVFQPTAVLTSKGGIEAACLHSVWLNLNRLWEATSPVYSNTKSHALKN